MPMRFPKRPDVTDEPPPFFEREGFPNGLCMRAKGIHDSPPIDSLLRRHSRFVSQKSHHRSNGVRELAMAKELRHGLIGPMRLWKKTPS